MPTSDRAPDPVESPQAELRVSPAAAWRLSVVVVGLGLMIAATYAIPGLQPVQPWKRGEGYVPYWNVIGRHFRGEGAARAEREERLERLKRESLATSTVLPSASQAPKPPMPTHAFPRYEPSAEDNKPVEVELVNARALDSYFRRLTLVDLGARVLARACHWGDSLLGDDGLTFALRTRLQARFGDGGHGFHVLAPFNTFYLHRGVRFQVVTPWSTRCELLFKCEDDLRFGLGGVSNRSSGGGLSRFSTMKEGPGQHVSHFELWYEKSPGGGAFEVAADGHVLGRVDTNAPERSDEVAAFELPDGPHRISVHALKNVRAYGVVLERGGPGVVWDNLAVIGTFTTTLSRQDPEHIAGQIRLRDPDLLVFSLSGNDAQRGAGDIRANYAREYVKTLTRYRAGKPSAACLILGVTAHGERTPSGIQVRRSVPEMVKVQREVALEQGCGFLDLYRAMGGAESLALWYSSVPALMGGDLGHPTSEGHAVLASLIYRALMRGYVEYRGRVTGQPLPELGGNALDLER